MSRPPYFVLSPIGTSLLLYQVSDQHRRLLNAHTNASTPAQVPEVEQHQIQALMHAQQMALAQAAPQLASEMSAELHGLIRLYDGPVQSSAGQPPDHHVLLCTDTWLGEFAGQCVRDWLKARRLNAEVLRLPDLQTAHFQPFQVALTDLVRWCDENLPGYRDAGYRIVFNLTGGFKSIQGFLQTLATFYADESVYIFERSETLLRIPRLPVVMHPDESIGAHLAVFRRLALGFSVAVNEVQAIPETLLMRLDDEVALSTWGDLVWKQTRPLLYTQQIWPSPSEKIRYGEAFDRSVKDLGPDRRKLVNERIDDLAVYLEGTGANLRSLDFKPLKGNPLPPATHEMDAWADQDAKRMFGYFDGDVFVIDRLGKALH